MNKLYIVIVFFTSLIFTSCVADKTIITDTKPDKSNTTSDDDIIKQYEKEGFIDKNTYVTLFVKTSDSGMTDAEIETQIKKRAHSALRKTIQDMGKPINAKTDTKLINLINDNGKISQIIDKKNSRKIFVLEIKKDNLKNYISEL